MSAPERFHVGDTVRCVDARGMGGILTAGRTYEVLSVPDSSDRLGMVADDRQWALIHPNRFTPVSHPPPPALDPFAWRTGTRRGSGGGLLHWAYVYLPAEERHRASVGVEVAGVEHAVGAFVAWSRFCYWAAQSNIAAHFLPTTPATRTRASNGRDVPVATTNAELGDCRRALGGEA